MYKHAKGFQGIRPSDLGPLKTEDLADLMLERLGVKVSRIEMQADFDDFCAFLGAATVNKAASQLLSGPKRKVKTTLSAYKAHMTERGLQAATINRRLDFFQNFMKLAITLGRLRWKPAPKDFNLGEVISKNTRVKKPQQKSHVSPKALSDGIDKLRKQNRARQ
jgi:hypothetical protein